LFSRNDKPDHPPMRCESSTNPGCTDQKVSPTVVQILVTGYGPLEEGEHGNTNTLIAATGGSAPDLVMIPALL